MNIAVVDDEKEYREALKEVLTQELQKIGVFDYHIDSFSSGEDFLKDYVPGYYQVTILDIYMGEHTGVDVARIIRERGDESILVFCTTSNDFASQSYEVSASFYLQKPLSKENVSTMLKRLKLSELNKTQLIQLPDGYSVQLSQILFTEHYNHYISFHLKNGVKHEVYMTHGEAEALLLSHPGFFTISQGSIVNLRNIKKADKEKLLLSNGTELSIPRRRSREVLDAYMQYRLSALEQELSF